MLTILNMGLVVVPMAVVLLGLGLAVQPSTAPWGALLVVLGIAGVLSGTLAALRSWRFRADSLALGRLGHELRTPVAVLTAWADQWNQPQGSPPDPAVLDRQLRRMRVMVEGTLHGARRLGHARAAPTPCLRAGGTGVPVSQVVEDLGRLWPSPEAVLTGQPADGIATPRLAWSLGPLEGLGQVPGDDRLTHILSNLIQNAFRHGVPRARPLVRPWLVRVSLGRNGSRLDLEVEDEGPGVRLHPLTGALESLDPSASRNPGAGLGFFLVRELTASAGGTLTVGPRHRGAGQPPRRGALVRVSLPVEEILP